MVGGPDRDATGSDDGVGIFTGRTQRRFKRRRIVFDHAHVKKIAAEPQQHAMQRVAIAVVDAARIEHFADAAQFVAGRKKRDPQTSLHRNLGHPERGKQAQIGRTQNAADIQCDTAAREVFAAQTPVVAATYRAGWNGHLRGTGIVREFLRDHGIAFRRHHRTGHDAHALAGSNRTDVRASGPCRADHLQGHCRVIQVRTAQGIPVHRRIVVCRDIDRRDDRGREDAPERTAQRDFFDGVNRCDELGNDFLCGRHW